MENLFEKSGEKIKKFARIIFYIYIIGAGLVLIGSFAGMMGQGVVFIQGIIFSVIIVLIGFVTALFLNAFGELVESNTKILDLLLKKEGLSEDSKIE